MAGLYARHMLFFFKNFQVFPEVVIFTLLPTVYGVLVGSQYCLSLF